MKKKSKTTRTKSKTKPIRRGASKNKVAKRSSKTSNLVSVNIKTHYDKNGGHPHVIVDDYKNNHISVGLTSDPYKGKGHRNQQLKSDPLRTGKTSYMHKQGTVDKKSNYTNPQEGKMHADDVASAKQIGQRALHKFQTEKEKPK